MSRQHTILVVTNTQADVDVLLGGLADELNVLVACDSQHTLDILSSGRVELLLLDTAMPQLDGFALCQKIKSNHLTRSIPVIFVLTECDEDKIDGLFDVGGADYVARPVREKTLSARIKAHLTFERLTPPHPLPGFSENQQTLQIFFDNTPDGILVVDDKGEIEKFNQSLLAMSGFEERELINAHFDLLLPDCHNLLAEYEANHQSIDGIIDARNIALVASSGKEFSVELSLSHYRQGESHHYLFFLRNNTEWQMKEALLRNSEEKLRTIIENASNVICTMDRHHQFTFLSPAWSEYLGYSVASGLGKLMDQFIYEDDIDAFNRALIQYDNGEFPRFECRLIHSSGALRWFMLSGRLVKGAGDAQFYVVVLEDITEHKAVVQALTESEERFRLLFESMSHGVVVIDEQGVPVITNQAVDNILGMSYPSLVKQLECGEVELVGEQQQPVSLEDFPPNVTMRSGESLHERVLGIRTHEDHQERWISMSVVAQAGEQAGKPERLFITFSDMTERRFAECAVQDYLRYLNVMERMNEVGIQAASVDDLLRNVLRELLLTLECQKAWIIYPCEAEQQLPSVPMLIDDQQNGGAIEAMFPIDDTTRQMVEKSFSCATPTLFSNDHGEGLPHSIASQYQLDAILTIAVFPKKSKPWLLCLCYGKDQPTPTQQDRLIVENIAKRLADYITSFDNLTSLRESEESLKEAQTIGQIGNWSHDLVKDVVYWSEQVYRILGKDSLWCIPQYDGFMDVVHPEDRDKVCQYDQQIRREGGKLGYDFRIIRADGAVRWVHAEIIADTEQGAVPSKVRGTFQDITQSKESGEQLKQAENQMRMILESAAEGIFGLDNAGNATFVNSSASKMLGYAPEEIVGKPVHPLIHHSYANGSEYPISECPFNQALVEGGVQRNQHDILWRKGGAHFPVEFSVMPLRSGESTFGAVVTFRDISEQIRAELEKKLLQNQLQQAQKMDAIGQLTGGVAHDFNNMLASILGYSELALRILSHSPNEKLVRYVEEIFKAGERGRDLIAKMLAFSRGIDDSKPEPILLEPLLTDVLKMLRSVMPASIAITTEVEEGVPAVMVDTINLQQIVMNLCINARDAMEGKGELHIVIRKHHCQDNYCASCHENFAGDYVELRITDSGCGIDQESLVRMFDPFFTTKEMGKGTGMGLSVVHGVVHSAGGHVGVSSSPGEGTTVSIYFPPTALHAKEESEAIELAAEETCVGKILVVDDEPSVGEFLREILRLYGYECDYQPLPLQALEQIKKQPGHYQLIISDVTMPEMTGIELAEAIHSYKSNLPVILCTGYSDVLTPEVVDRIGVLRVLKKPLNSVELLESVADALGVVS